MRSGSPAETPRSGRHGSKGPGRSVEWRPVPPERSRPAARQSASPSVRLLSHSGPAGPPQHKQARQSRAPRQTGRDGPAFDLRPGHRPSSSVGYAAPQTRQATRDPGPASARLKAGRALRQSSRGCIVVSGRPQPAHNPGDRWPGAGPAAVHTASGPLLHSQPSQSKGRPAADRTGNRAQENPPAGSALRLPRHPGAPGRGPCGSAPPGSGPRLRRKREHGPDRRVFRGKNPDTLTRGCPH